MTDQPAPTIGDVIDETLGMRDNYHSPFFGHGEITLEVCEALGIDPATPAANLVVLQPGQAVVEGRPWHRLRASRTRDQMLWCAGEVVQWVTAEGLSGKMDSASRRAVPSDT